MNPAGTPGPQVRNAGGVEDLQTMLAGAIDPRIAEVWTLIFSLDLNNEELPGGLPGLLRMAYLAGYQDGQSEAPGALFSDIDIPKALSSSAPAGGVRPAPGRPSSAGSAGGKGSAA